MDLVISVSIGEESIDIKQGEFMNLAKKFIFSENIYINCFMNQFKDDAAKKIVDFYEARASKEQLKKDMHKSYKIINSGRHTTMCILGLLPKKEYRDIRLWKRYKENGGEFILCDGKTAFHLLAAEYIQNSSFILSLKKILGNEIIQILSTKCWDGNNPLHIICSIFHTSVGISTYPGSLEFLKLLVENGANLFAPNKNKAYPFCLLSERNKEMVSRILNYVKPLRIISNNVCCACLKDKPTVVLSCGHVCFCDNPECQKVLNKCSRCRAENTRKIGKFSDSTDS